MRILHVSPFPPERDGIGDYCSMLCRELVRGAHRVAVISARPSPAPAPEMIGSLPRRADKSQQLLAAVDAFRPEVVHVEFALASYGTALPALLHLLDRFRADGLPVVITMHEVTRDIA